MFPFFYIAPRKQSVKKIVVPVPSKFKTVCSSLSIAKIRQWHIFYVVDGEGKKIINVVTE